MSDELESLQQRLLDDPTARARFLADTLELLERNGVATHSAEFQQQIKPALDLSQGANFVGGLAASTLVLVVAGAAQRGVGGNLGKAASSVVIVAASAGQRGIGSDPGKAASSVVIVAASAGQRGIGSDPGKAATSVVIAVATAGQRGVGGNLGKAASSVVIVAASAGQRGVGRGIGTQAEIIAVAMPTGATQRQGPMEDLPADAGGTGLSVPAALTIAEIAMGLRALAQLLENESVELDRQVQDLTPDAQS